MGSINKVILIGRLGKDPEMRFTPSGRAVTNFTLATDESYTDTSGERQERTEWHRIISWGKLAEYIAKTYTKGKQVYIEGRLQTRTWDDKDGNKRYVTEVIASKTQKLFASTKDDESQDDRASGGEPEGDDNNNGYHSFDDIPF